jgi:hypothetical protein
MSRKNRSNKRRRSQAFPADDDKAEHTEVADDLQNVDGYDGEEGAEHAEVIEAQVEEQPAAAEHTEDPEDTNRKQEIWEVFQEEHHEGMFSLHLASLDLSSHAHSCPVLEQLPLSLQRSYTLVSELDEQVKSKFI